MDLSLPVMVGTLGDVHFTNRPRTRPKRESFGWTPGRAVRYAVALFPAAQPASQGVNQWTLSTFGPGSEA